MGFDVQNGVTGAINGVLDEPKPKAPAKKPETTTDEEGAE